MAMLDIYLSVFLLEKLHVQLQGDEQLSFENKRGICIDGWHGKELTKANLVVLGSINFLESVEEMLTR